MTKSTEDAGPWNGGSQDKMEADNFSDWGYDTVSWSLWLLYAHACSQNAHIYQISVFKVNSDLWEDWYM